MGFCFRSSLNTLAVYAGLLLLGLYSTFAREEPKPAFVRKVDFSDVPKQARLAERARRIGNEMYPQVCSLLADGKTEFPRKFDIYLKRKLQGRNSGETSLTRISLDVGFLDQREEDLEYFDHILIHEMAHVAQHYNRPIIGHWLVTTSHPVAYWVEGIADYVYFKLCRTNGQACADCGLRFPDYRSGYSCAGAFLLYVEKTYNPNLVRQLNTALRKGGYSDDFFQKATGKALPEFWAEFERTSAFSPNAARMLDLQRKLGYADGKVPQDLGLRFKAFLNLPANAGVKELLEISGLPSVQKGDPSAAMIAFLYFTQTNGTAETFIIGLQQAHRLPGIGKARGLLSGPLRLSDMDPDFPCTRLFTATREGDPSTYHYQVCCPASGAQWQLQRAWRSDAKGRMEEEYPLRGTASVGPKETKGN